LVFKGDPGRGLPVSENLHLFSLACRKISAFSGIMEQKFMKRGW